MPELTTPPWTPVVVKALNDGQYIRMLIPVTCQAAHDTPQRLTAAADGWHCPVASCAFWQRWALAYRADPVTMAGFAAASPRMRLVPAPAEEPTP
jgi:hypothetical protein